MPDILVVSSKIKFIDQVRSNESLKDIRFKFILSNEFLVEWVNLRNFNALVIDVDLSLSDINQATTIFSDIFPSATIIGFSNDNNDSISLAKQAELADLGVHLILKDVKLVEALKTFLPDNNQPVSKVLIVEDLEAPREIIGMYLEQLGYQVVSTESVPQALNELAHHSDEIFCILTDLRMPNISGVELIKQVRASQKHSSLPVVVLSAYGTGTSLVECLEAGASGFLVKPLIRVDLQRELNRAKRIVSGAEEVRLLKSGSEDLIRELLTRRGFLI